MYNIQAKFGRAEEGRKQHMKKNLRGDFDAALHQAKGLRLMAKGNMYEKGTEILNFSLQPSACCLPVDCLQPGMWVRGMFWEKRCLSPFIVGIGEWRGNYSKMALTTL
jgi:hypothetical protein